MVVHPTRAAAGVTNVFYALMPAIPEHALFNRLDLMLSFVDGPSSERFHNVDRFILQPLGIEHDDIKRPKDFGGMMERFDHHGLERFAGEIAARAQPHLSIELFQLSAFPSTQYLQMHRMDPLSTGATRVIESLDHHAFRNKIVSEQALTNFETSVQIFRKRRDAAREAILTGSHELAGIYVDKTGISPDQTSLFMLWQVHALHKFSTAAPATLANALAALRLIHAAYELPTDGLVMPKQYDHMRFAAFQAGALAAAKAVVSEQIVMRYIRARSRAPFIFKSRLELLNYAHTVNVVSDDTYRWVMDLHRPSRFASIGAFLTSWRRRKPPTPGSIDEFFRFVSNEKPSGRPPIIHDPIKKRPIA